MSPLSRRDFAKSHSGVKLNPGFQSLSPSFQSQPCRPPASWPQTVHFSFLSLSFHKFKIAKRTVTSQVVVKVPQTVAGIRPAGNQCPSLPPPQSLSERALSRDAGSARSQGRAAALPGARSHCVAFRGPRGSRPDLCLFWQGRESQDTQSKPLNLLTVWDWSVQFEPRAQTLLQNPLYVEKPKLDKGQRKGTRFKVRCPHAYPFTCPEPPRVEGRRYVWTLETVCRAEIWGGQTVRPVRTLCF